MASPDAGQEQIVFYYAKGTVDPGCPEKGPDAQMIMLPVSAIGALGNAALRGDLEQQATDIREDRGWITVPIVDLLGGHRSYRFRTREDEEGR